MPRPTTVSAMVPLSTVLLAPTSTSAPSVTEPSEWIRTQGCRRVSPCSPSVRRERSTPFSCSVVKLNPSPPITAF